jgi:hypothetical protein
MAKGIEFNPRNEFSVVGDYDIPMLDRQEIGDTKHLRWIPYTSALSFGGDKSRTGVHFFIYDKGFENIWNAPWKLRRLQGFRYVTTPDFSTYTDMPIAFQIWNCFRAQWIGCFMQRQLKLTVIPTLRWSTEDSYKFCFDGIPLGTVCAMNSVGKGLGVADRKVFLGHRASLKVAVKRLEPERILVYSGVKEMYPPYNYEDIESFSIGMNHRKKAWDARLAKSFPKGQTVFELD